MVYVISCDGTPLMPSENHGKVRHLLKTGKAKVIKRDPFTIQLLYGTTKHVLPVTLGVDAGSKFIGLSASTEKKELFRAEVQLRTDIVDLLSERRQYRRGRRSRNTRYRPPRFQNRTYGKKKGRLAPSIENQIATHLRMVERVCKFLPVHHILIETASFDIQKINNPDIEGIQYQQGDQLGFWNIREYVFFRDNHTCQQCHGKSRDKILNVHHIESRKTGGDSPRNLVTLCETCHTKLHKGLIQATFKRGRSFRHEAFMGLMRRTFYNRLKTAHLSVGHTYGYITKNTRITHGLEKSHGVDALCISGHPTATPQDHCYFYRQVRRHNRSLHKSNTLKGGIRKKNQAPYEVNGFRLFDKIRYQGQDGFIFGRRTSGYFDIRTLNGTVIHRSASHKKLTLVQRASTLLTERRKAS